MTTQLTPYSFRKVPHKISDLVRSDEEKEACLAFVRLKEIFPNLVHDIFLIPSYEFDTRPEYKARLNLGIQIRGFSILSYMRWAARNKKSVVHLWDTKAGRARFWSPKLLRLIIALGQIQAKNDYLRIWLKSYSRVVSLGTFVDDPPVMQTVEPLYVYKLTE